MASEAEVLAAARSVSQAHLDCEAKGIAATKAETALKDALLAHQEAKARYTNAVAELQTLVSQGVDEPKVVEVKTTAPEAPLLPPPPSRKKS